MKKILFTVASLFLLSQTNVWGEEIYIDEVIVDSTAHAFSTGGGVLKLHGDRDMRIYTDNGDLGFGQSVTAKFNEHIEGGVPLRGQDLYLYVQLRPKGAKKVDIGSKANITDKVTDNSHYTITLSNFHIGADEKPQITWVLNHVRD